MLNADDSNDIEFDESLNQTEINQSLRQIMTDNETAKLAVDITFLILLINFFLLQNFLLANLNVLEKWFCFLSI